MAFLAELVGYGPRVRVRPEDETGLLDLAMLLAEPRGDTLVYCCGPEPPLVAVERCSASWPSGAPHVERLTPSDAPSDALSDEGQPAGDEFEVVLERSGLTLTVPPGVSIPEAVEKAGASVLSSCREGTCGTCETGVLEGIPDHRDHLLTDAEKAANDVMMICRGRARGPRLVLDL
jgi:ferredoxin